MLLQAFEWTPHSLVVHMGNQRWNLIPCPDDIGLLHCGPFGMPVSTICGLVTIARALTSYTKSAQGFLGATRNIRAPLHQ